MCFCYVSLQTLLACIGSVAALFCLVPSQASLFMPGIYFKKDEVQSAIGLASTVGAGYAALIGGALLSKKLKGGGPRLYYPQIRDPYALSGLYNTPGSGVVFL